MKIQPLHVLLCTLILLTGCGGAGSSASSSSQPTQAQSSPTSDLNALAAVGDVLVTYPGLPNDQYKSDRYVVEVSQADGVVQRSYTYLGLQPADISPTADYAIAKYYTKTNHFTTFSASGAVTVKVTLPNRTTPITKAFVRPLAKGITPVVSGNTVTFTMNGPANVFLDIPDEVKQPLFVFNNPVEQNVPLPTDPNVYYFGPGVYDIGTSGSIYQRLPAGSTVYLAGGAYVRGSFQRDNNTYSSTTYGGNLTVRGRGILSQIGYLRYPAATAVPLIYSKYGSVQAEGIIMTDMTGFAVESYYGKSTQYSVVDNLKIFGWYAHADGPHVGPYGIVKNCFLKTGDDNLFAFFNNQQVIDNTVWQQQSAVIQLSWNLVNDTNNMTIRGLDVIGSDMSVWHPGPGYFNTALIAMHNLEGARYTGLTIQDVRVETPLLQVFAIQTMQNWDNKPQLAGRGFVDGVVFKNIDIAKMPNYPGIFNGNGVSTGAITNVTFDNVSIGGTKLTAGNSASFFSMLGSTSGFVYY